MNSPNEPAPRVCEYADGTVWLIKRPGDGFALVPAWIAENQRRERKKLTLMGRIRRLEPSDRPVNVEPGAC